MRVLWIVALLAVGLAGFERQPTPNPRFETGASSCRSSEPLDLGADGDLGDIAVWTNRPR